jgi:hypothetical protein
MVCLTLTASASDIPTALGGVSLKILIATGSNSPSKTTISEKTVEVGIIY